MRTYIILGVLLLSLVGGTVFWLSRQTPTEDIHPVATDPTFNEAPDTVSEQPTPLEVPLGAPTYVEGVYNLTFKEGVSVAAAEQIVREAGGEVVSTLPLTSVILQVRLTQAQKEVVERALQIERITQDAYLHSNANFSFPRLVQESFHTPVAQAAGAVDLFIVDSGQHGSDVTAVARETMSALGGRNVTIHGIDITANGAPFSIGTAAQGIYQATQQGAEVINLSMAEECADGSGRPARCGKDPVLEDIFRYANSQGALIVKSAGNNSQVPSDWVGSSGVLVVGGLEEVPGTTGGLSWCVSSDRYAGGTSRDAVDFYTAAAGPGGNGNGTSFAAPRLSVRSAILVAEGTSLTKSGLMSALRTLESDTYTLDRNKVLASGAVLFSEGEQRNFDNPATSGVEYVTCMVPAAAPVEPPPVTDEPVEPAPDEPSVADSAPEERTGVCPQNFNLLPDDACTLEGFLNILLDAVVSIGSILLVLALVWTGFLFIKAQGSEEEIRSARSALVWVVFGGLLLLGAQAMSMVIKATIETL